MPLHRSSISIQSLYTMHQHGFLPSRDTIYEVLQICTIKNDLLSCKQVHLLMCCYGFDAFSALGDHVIRLFSRHGSLFEASITFCKVIDPSMYTWNAIMSSYIKHGEYATTIHLYDVMQEEGDVQPNKYIFSCMFKAFGSLKVKRKGQVLHSKMVKIGHDLDEYIRSAMIDMYTNCGCLNEANDVLNALRTQDVVSWNALIVGYIQNGHDVLALKLYEEMNNANINPTKVTLSSILKACSSIAAIQEGMCIHDFIIKSELEMDVIVGGSIVNMYAKCGTLIEAMSLFNSYLCIRTRVNWNALLVGCVQHERNDLAFELYEKMQEEGISPDNISFGCMLGACSHYGQLAWGRIIHDAIVRNGFNSHMTIGSTLIELYVNYGALSEAHKVFDELPDPSLCSWCVLIRGYTLHGHNEVALELFKEMHAMGLEADKQMFLCTIQACGNKKSIEQGRLLHCHIVQSGLDLDIDVGTTLISMYANCGDFSTSHIVLQSLPKHDLISWSAVICAYVGQGHFVHALQAYEEFSQSDINIMLDEVTCSHMVKACTEVGAIYQCNQILMQIFKSGFDKSVMNISLLEMYIQHGRLEEAYKTLIIDNGSNLLASWNTMIAGCVQHGNSILARRCFEEMQSRGIQPDERTFTSTLSACCHGGEIEYGLKVFKAMQNEYGITPGIEHVNCIVDLLGRGGWLDEAKALIKRMPHLPDVAGWRSLLTSSSKFGHQMLGNDC